MNSVRATIEGERRVLDYSVRLATDYLDIDTRPLVYDGHFLQRIGPSPVPDELTTMIAEQQIKIALLEVELREAYERERLTESSHQSSRLT